MREREEGGGREVARRRKEEKEREREGGTWTDGHGAKRTDAETQKLGRRATQRGRRGRTGPPSSPPRWLSSRPRSRNANMTALTGRLRVLYRGVGAWAMCPH